MEYIVMQVEGHLLLPRSPRVPFYIDLRPEAGYTFAPFGEFKYGTMTKPYY